MRIDDINELVESAASYAGNLYRGLDKIVQDLREYNIKDGLGDLAKATEGLEWLTNAVIVINESGEYNGFSTDPAKEFFSEMVEAAENMDFVLLTDLIEYEILPIIDEWGNHLDDILENM